MERTLKPYHIFILVLLIALASVMGLLFIPALPDLARYFKITDSKAQHTISIFLIGYALGQLPYGPLGNRLGRKKTIYIGITLSFIGSLLCYASPNFLMLCISRFIQALGAAVGLKMSFTLVGDLLKGKEASKVVSLLSIAFGIMPGLSVATGGVITEQFGWRMCFLFLAFYALIIGLLTLALPETAKKLDPNALEGKVILKKYLEQIRNPSLMLYACLVSLSTMFIYLFATVSPYLSIDRLQVKPDIFGLWNIFPAFGLVLGALLSKYLSQKFPLKKNIFLGMCIMSSGVIVMTLSFSLGYLNIGTLFIGQFIIQSGYNLVWSNANVASIADAEDKSNATTIVQFINVGGSVFATFLISMFSPLSTMLLPIAFCSIVLLMFLIRFLANNKSNGRYK